MREYRVLETGTRCDNGGALVSHAIRESRVCEVTRHVISPDEGLVACVRDGEVSEVCECDEKVTFPSEADAAEERADVLAREIRSWDTESIKELQDMVREFMKLCEAHELDETRWIDWGNLPTAPFPEALDTSYPAWAMDKAGYCIVGNRLEDIEPVNEILAQQGKPSRP